MVRIVEVTPILFPKFYNCFEVLMEEGYSGFSPRLKEYFIKKEYSQSNLMLWFEKQFRKIFLALNDMDEVIGFIVGDNTYGGVAFITWLGILKQYRNLGIGKKLLEVYEGYIKTKNAHLIELFTYESVREFYIKNGFFEVGRREQGFFGQSNIIMNKKIGFWNDNNIPSV